MYYILISLIVILIIYIIYFKNKVNKLGKDNYYKLNNELSEKYKNRLWEISSLEQKEEEKLSEAKRRAELCEERTRGLESALEDKRRSATEIEARLQSQLESKKENVDLTLQNYYNSNYNSFKSQLDSILSQIKSESSEELEEFLERNREEIVSANLELSSLKSEIEDYRQKREIINKEILRQREISENQNFYRVCLTDEAKADIELLTSIMPRISKRESFNKLIYDTYIAKPVNEMIKRVLGSRTPTGIYKITRLKTGEIYIGKSTNIHDRWQQHCKSAFHVGTISHSQLHTTMELDGIENWTFEVIEECSKENLTTRESYWIKFYGSKEYGLNMKE